MRRRRLLALLGTASTIGATSLSGCLGSGASTDDGATFCSTSPTAQGTGDVLDVGAGTDVEDGGIDLLVPLPRDALDTVAYLTVDTESGVTATLPVDAGDESAADPDRFLGDVTVYRQRVADGLGTGRVSITAFGPDDEELDSVSLRYDCHEN
ncbi:hypothetical protein [Haloarchaeobius sp. HRN-SO-5]|uniref:hypothetical protein n=1 Tax=Haloarchaeobius sp. HRN-SO-5 TaxID=3446118 RepID=UPI003EBDDE15